MFIRILIYITVIEEERFSMLTCMDAREYEHEIKIRAYIICTPVHVCVYIIMYTMSMRNTDLFPMME